MNGLRRYIRPVATIVSVALFVYLIRRTGPQTVFQNVRLLGWSMLLLILLSGIRHVLRAQAWSWSVQTEGARPAALQLLGPRLMGEALNDLTPAGPLLGEPAKIAAVSKWVGAEDAASSVVIENLIYLLSALLFMMSGVVLALLKVAALRSQVWIAAGLAVCFAGPVAFLFWAICRRRLLLASVLDCLNRCGLRCALLDRHGPSLCRVESMVYDFFRQRKRAFLGVFAAEIATNFTGICEAYVILAATTGSSSVLAAYLVETVSRAVQLAFSFVPLGLGVQEGATAATLQTLGGAAGAGVSLAIIRKIRSLFWAGIGLCLMPKYAAIFSARGKNEVEVRRISEIKPAVATAQQRRTRDEVYEIGRLAS